MQKTLFRARYRALGAGAAAALLLCAAAAAAPLPPPAPAPAARTHEVQMIGGGGGGGEGARFAPAKLTVSSGDTVVFVVKSGEPHNIAFDSTALSSAQRSALRNAVHDAMLPFASPLLLASGDRYVLSTAGLPSGTYDFYCMPHMAVKMRGTLVVK